MPVIVILPKKQGILYQRPFIFLFIHLIMEYQMVLDIVSLASLELQWNLNVGLPVRYIDYFASESKI